MIGFSNPIVTTRKGSPSDNSTILMGTPSLVVTSRPNKNAKMPDSSTDVASQKLEPSRFMERNKEMNVRCIDKYPSAMMTMSRVSACCRMSATDRGRRYIQIYLDQINKGGPSVAQPHSISPARAIAIGPSSFHYPNLLFSVFGLFFRTADLLSRCKEV